MVLISCVPGPGSFPAPETETLSTRHNAPRSESFLRTAFQPCAVLFTLRVFEEQPGLQSGFLSYSNPDCFRKRLQLSQQRTDRTLVKITPIRSVLSIVGCADTRHCRIRDSRHG